MIRANPNRQEVFFKQLNRALLGVDDAQIQLRLRMPFFWLVALILLALLLPDRVWTTLLIGISGLILVAFIWARQLARGLSGRRRLQYGWVSVGDRLEESFQVDNRSGFPALWIEIRDESNLPGYRAAAVRAVSGTDYTKWKQSSVCRQRGQYHLGPWELHSGDPFGVYRVIHRYDERQEIVIHPPIHSPLPIPLPPGRAEGRTRSRERAWQATNNAATVRDYHDADPFHWIHWPTTARKDHLYVRQFEQDAAGDIWLVLDTEAAVHIGEGMSGTEEHAVLMAASLVARSISEMRGVGIAAYGSQPQVVPPALGQGQQWRLLRALALLRCDGSTDLSRSLYELADSARRGSAAIILTSRADADWLPALNTLAERNIECHVILLDRVSFGGLEANDGLCRVIRSLGFNCRTIKQGELGRPLIDEERHGFWEFKVTGTGKAIAVRRPTD